MIIAIDGPAGAGKSTVARALARALGYCFLDTGAMYRAIALSVLRHGADPKSEEACRDAAERHRLSFDVHGAILIDGVPGEPDIRSAEVEKIVSDVSAHRAVRELVVRAQREIAERAVDVVAEGRDTTSVVFPAADHKFFLNASADERARRKAAQLGRPELQSEIRTRLEARDRLDSTRIHSPLTLAKDAVLIETDGLDADGVVKRLLEHVHGVRS